MNKKLELRKFAAIWKLEALAWFIYSIGLWTLNQMQMSTIVTVFYGIMGHFLIAMIFTKSSRFLQFFYVIPQPLAAIKQKRIILFVVACAIMHLITVSTYHSIGN